MRHWSLDALHPRTWLPALQATRTLWFDYAHLRSVLSHSSVDADGRPVPWYTYPAIEYLKQLDFREARVFEYGGGNSTLFWASVAREVVSVDDDEQWYATLVPSLPKNGTLLLETDLSRYADVINRFPGGFDIVVVDGAARGQTRLKCCRHAVHHLRRGGMVILDNSDWLPESARTLREAGLIQVDMTGLIPIGGHTQTTSLFLDREFHFAPRGNRQPLPGPGAVSNVWEHPPSTRAPLVTMDGEAFGGVRRNEAFAFDTPEGARRFSLVVASESPTGPGCAAILDLDQQRVLISLNDTDPEGNHVAASLAAASRLPWREFCAFIDAHDKKRYRLTPAGHSNSAMTPA
jgi:hypothetical protein